jgi:hypothetical protein
MGALIVDHTVRRTGVMRTGVAASSASIICWFPMYIATW